MRRFKMSSIQYICFVWSDEKKNIVKLHNQLIGFTNYILNVINDYKRMSNRSHCPVRFFL